MIGRLLNAAWTTAVYFCVATLISQVFIAAYIWFAWGMDSSRLPRVVAVARGIDLVAADQEIDKQAEKVGPEQVSYEQILEVRAVDVRYLELREEALANGLAQLGFEQRKLGEEGKRFAQQRKTFDTQLASLNTGAKAQGLDENRRTLETIKPKQAKEQLMLMLDKDELDKVVVLLAGMSDSKRAKIAGEFKTAEEAEKLSDILKRIREGVPLTEIAEQTKDKLQTIDAAGS